MCASRRDMVEMSLTRGTFSRRRGSVVRMAAAIAGSAAFFAPLISTVPSRRRPPSMRNLSILLTEGALTERGTEIASGGLQAAASGGGAGAGLEHDEGNAEVAIRGVEGAA